MKTLLSNPKWMTEKCVGTTVEIRKFKVDPTVKCLKTFQTELCSWKGKSYTPQVPKSTKRNLAQLLDFDDDNNMNPAGEFSMSSPKPPQPGKRETTTTQKRRK